jgi:hypothetical protein
VTEQVDEVRAAIKRLQDFRTRLTPETATMMRVADVLETIEFEPAQNDLRGLMFYPDSADFGGLNAMGHDVQAAVSRVRSLLATKR